MDKQALVKMIRAVGYGLLFSFIGYILSGSDLSLLLGTYIMYKELCS